MLYRNWRYEQELDSLLWKVNYKDIQIKEQKDEAAGVNEAPAKCNSKVNAPPFSLTSPLSPVFHLPVIFVPSTQLIPVHRPISSISI